MQCVEFLGEVPQGVGVLRLCVPGILVRILIDCHCVADGVEVTHRVITTMRQLFIKDEGVEF
jgi:hypothetical protein